MSTPDPGLTPPANVNARFATTRWNLVQAAAERSDPESDAALGTLCGLYWYPVYAFIRRRGRPPEQAQDLAQEFFVRLLEKEYLKAAEPRRGRFRSFLLAAVSHFLANERDRETAQKRGGGRVPLSIDLRQAEGRLAIEPAAGSTPEREFERRWAVTLLEHTLARLRAEHATPEKAALFEQLQPLLPKGEQAGSLGEAARRLRMSEGAVRVALYRMRKRFGVLLREEIGQTVTCPEEVEDEIRDLFTALARG